MKRVIHLVLVAGVAFLLGHFLRAPIPHAGAMGGGTMPVSGDVNGDGILDIADAVYIIDYQLRGGPPPLPIACPPAVLPATGQTKCYDDSGKNEIPCDSPDFPGQDGFYHAGCPTEGRFVDNGDGTVTDFCTGLMWQKETADVNENGEVDYPLPGDRINWQDRISWQTALKYCENLDFAGYHDWRLPNLRELQSIVDYGRGAPSTDPVFGPSEEFWYWSSTSYADGPRMAWVVNLGGASSDAGSVGVSAKDASAQYVRAVRTIQPGE